MKAVHIRSKAVAVLLALALSACSGPASTPPSQVAATPTPEAADDDAPPLTVDESPDQLEEPANPGFIGKVWISTTPGSARGSILVFLPDRTLLMDSCFETFRLSKWGVAGEHIRWLEDTIPIEAEVELPSNDELHLKISGQDRVQTYVAASVPYVCPDMPR